MIYQGAVIRRLVTPNHPGDPVLDDPNTELQFRVEYVLKDRGDDQAGRPALVWTKDFAAALRYPRHLDADRRAVAIGGMAHARVVTADGAEPFQMTARSPRRPAEDATNFSPAEGGSSARAEEQPPGPHHFEDEPDRLRVPMPKRSTSLSRAAGEKTLRKSDTGKRRPETIRTWWRHGQYA